MGEFDEPFPGSWAVDGGLITRWHLRRHCTRIHPDVYVAEGATIDARTRAIAAGHWAKGAGVLVGRSASALHGTKWIDSSAPAELAGIGRRRPPPGIVVRQGVIPAAETCVVGGFSVTTPARTGFDLGRQLLGEQAVIALDALCNATGTSARQIADLAAEHPGERNVLVLNDVLALVDGGAESPPETRLRLLLVEDGLPQPTTQLRIRDEYGRVVARADLGWPEWKVAVEYDGVQHWSDEEQRTWDIDRREILAALGWIVVHVNSKHLRANRWQICERVRRSLRANGAPV